MKKWILTASSDAVNIDFETVIKSRKEPDFWTCYDIATANGCEYFYLTEAETEQETIKNLISGFFGTIGFFGFLYGACALAEFVTTLF